MRQTTAHAEDMNAGAVTLPKPAARPADWLVEHDPVTPNASPEARALLKYLYSISGKHTLIGQHNFAGVHERSTLAAARKLGKTPALYGTDWGFSRAGDIDSIHSRENTVQEIIKQYRSGSIIALCWHEVRPTADEPVTFRGSPTSVQGHLTNAEWAQLMAPGSEIHKRWCAQVDVIAGYLKQLEAAHVPILWRPAHEMNGDWFWWGGRLGDRGTKQYYRMMFERLVGYHKLTNLIWVWNCDQPSRPDRQFVDYFPGQQYVDVLALDCYGAFQQRFYDEMNALSNGKLMAISEGGPPALDIYKTQPKWAYYMPWATARRPVSDSRTTPAPEELAAAIDRAGRSGGDRRGGVDWAAMARDPRMLGLEDAAYRESIRPLRAASGLPTERPAVPSAREVRSPDGTIALSVHTDGPLGYSITVDGKPVLARSRLGLELADSVRLGEEPVVQGEERRSADTHWENPFGKNRDVRDHYNELILTLKDGARTFGVVARAYDDGAAFRLVLPRQDSMESFTVTRDLAELTFADDHQVWAGWNNAEGKNRPEGGFIGSQEWWYAPNTLSKLNPRFKHGLPFLIHTPAAYVAVTESDLRDWSAMWLVPKAGAKNTLEVQLAPPIPARPWKDGLPAPDGAAVGNAPLPTGAVQHGLVVARTPHQSPWRTFLIARKPHELIRSDLVLNLATPSQIADTSWIKPGMAAWGSWWPNMGRNDLPTLKQYIQLAADMGWSYQLSEIRDKSIVPELVAYGKERGVRIWLWYHFNDFVEKAVYEREFPRIAAWGVAGLKIDFMDRDDQWAVNWYEDIARCAAANHLMIDFHGAFKPTGLERTWPNQLTREGIQGNEYNKWSDRETPEHRATLPFTRMLAGPGDYTPGGFANRQPSQFRKGARPTQVQATRAGELAMFLLIHSPFCVACDAPAHYRDQAGNYLTGMDFLKGLPTVWDETRGLAGEVGRYVVEARRRGDKWYLAAITDGQARDLPVPLAFLGSGDWNVTLWQDAPDSDQDAEHLVRSERGMHPYDTLSLTLAPSGGTVAIFSPAK